MKHHFFHHRSGGLFPCLLALVVLAQTAAAVVVTGFSDLQSWTGSGANQSGLVIQWNDGKEPETLAWGFRWDSPVTVADMIMAIAGANSGLHLRVDGATQYGPAIFGIGFDVNQSGTFGVSGALDQAGSPAAVTFTNGISDMNTDPNSVQAPLSSTGAGPTDPADHYEEAWFDNGFWEIFTGLGTSYPSVWESSLVGSGETLLSNGWYAFSLSNADYSSNLPGAATAAVPEPAAILLLLVGGGCLIHARRRIHTA